MGPDDVTSDWMSEVLGVEAAVVSTDRIGDGLVGMNLRVALSGDDGVPSSVVIKLPSADPTSRATGIALRNYEREVKFYLEVATTVEIRVPHCFHGAWDEKSGDFVLVLEDMAPAEVGDQVAGCAALTAGIAVAELARLHGPRWDDPTLDELDWLTRRTGPDDVAQLAGLWEMFYPPFLATYRRHLTPEAEELATAFGPRLGAWMDGRVGPRAVTHGDYRLDNLLFGTAAGGPPVTAVDWQTPGHGAPVADLSYFCGAGLLPAERRTHERALVELYGRSLAELSVDVDGGWLWEQYRRDAFAGVIMAVIASQIVGESERSEAMFAAMATRHLQHALDLDSLAAI
ncbi:MAG: phosphotransferase family protein [Ilumatobacteraceae bacterium]